MVKLKIKKESTLQPPEVTKNYQFSSKTENNKNVINTVTKDSIAKKDAAIEVLIWLMPLRIACIVGIIFPFICIALVVNFLENLAIVFWIVATIYLGWILVKVTRHKNYLEVEYGLKRQMPPRYRLYK